MSITTRLMGRAVPRSILKGHSDQWNDAFTGMMTAMIALSRE